MLQVFLCLIKKYISVAAKSTVSGFDGFGPDSQHTHSFDWPSNILKYTLAFQLTADANSLLVEFGLGKLVSI